MTTMTPFVTLIHSKKNIIYKIIILANFLEDLFSNTWS